MNQIDLKGRFAAVTGGAKGIGYAVAERLLQSGAGVAIWDLDSARLESAKAGLAKLGRTEAFLLDVTNAGQVEKVAQATIKSFGKLDILVNSAGIAGPVKKVWETTPEEWRQVIDIDLNGTFLCCRAVVPHMMANKYGRIVNIASIAGKEGNPNAGHYSAAKAGVMGLTKSLGKELATTGILVNAITPAAIRTEIFDQITQQHIDFMLSKIPMGRLGLVEEAAAMIAWLCSADCSFSTGAVFDLSGGRATY
jgi:2-dehydro-3-deoxy-L-rhamnonate dehydrogenase (NAD+)